MYAYQTNLGQYYPKSKTIEMLRNSLLANCGIKLEHSKKRPKKFEHEITMVRGRYRERLYLENYDVDEALTSITDEPLDMPLCDFSFIAKENYKAYKDELEVSGRYGSRKLPPIFITTEDRDNFKKIENKTIAEIKENIAEIANSMPDKDITSILLRQVSNKTNKRKHEYIQMFYEAKKHLEEQLADLLSQIIHRDKINDIVNSS